MIKKIVLYLIIMFLYFACNSKIERKQDSQNNIEHDTLSYKLYTNDNFKEIKFRNGKVKRFYNNGNLFSIGFLNGNNQEIGQWNYYTKESQLSEMREYLIIAGESNVNQLKFYRGDKDSWFVAKDPNFNIYEQKDLDLDTLNYNLSFYTEFEMGKDTIQLNESWKAAAFYYTPIFKDKESEVVVVLGDFNEDFSNVKQVQRDTFYNLAKDIQNQKWFPDDNPKTTVVFVKWFNTTGEKEIKGFLSEYYEDSLKNVTEIRTYFEKQLYVKDSL